MAEDRNVHDDSYPLTPPLDRLWPGAQRCPHCIDGHESPHRCAWGVTVGPERDSDGQPIRLYVQPTAGAHVANEDAEWLWRLIRHGLSICDAQNHQMHTESRPRS